MIFWKFSWNTSDQGRYCYSIYLKVKVFPWFRHLPVGRNFICSFSRLMNMTDSNICECTKSYEDIDHIVFECSRFDAPREKLLDSIISLSHDIPV